MLGVGLTFGKQHSFTSHAKTNPFASNDQKKKKKRKDVAQPLMKDHSDERPLLLRHFPSYFYLKESLPLLFFFTSSFSRLLSVDFQCGLKRQVQPH